MPAKPTKPVAKPATKPVAKPAIKPARLAAGPVRPAIKSTKPVARPVKPAPAATPSPKSAKPAPTAKPAPSATAKAKATVAPDPLEVVKPLIRVRQMREFTGRRVTRAEVDAITEVARWTGSSRNEQPCRYIVIRDPETIRRVAELGLPQTRGLPTASAAIAIVMPDEPEREPSRAFDDGRAAERILVAAHLLGIGGGISQVRADVRDGIDRALGLPANRSVRTIVALGHPTEDARAPKSKPGHARLPREEVIFAERWPTSARHE